MERDSEYELEEDSLSDSSRERSRQQRKPHKGGRIIREEPTILRELQASPLAISYFKHQACFEFCGMIERVRFHHELARLFVTHLHKNEMKFAGVTFTISPVVISEGQ